jgi:hypothetical protein
MAGEDRDTYGESDALGKDKIEEKTLPIGKVCEKQGNDGIEQSGDPEGFDDPLSIYLRLINVHMSQQGCLFSITLNRSLRNSVLLASARSQSMGIAFRA